MHNSKNAVILIGPPGSGKSVVAREIGERYHVAFIETGQMLRNEVKQNTALGKAIESYLAAGTLVPTDLIRETVIKAVGNAALPTLLFDGFPRKKDQIEEFKKMTEELGIQLSAVIVLTLPRSLINRRLTGRRYCPVDGSVYNIYFNPPRKNSSCDLCGTPLLQREDDTPAVVGKRLDVYEKNTVPVIKYFRTYYPGLTYVVPADTSLSQEAHALSVILDKVLPRTARKARRRRAVSVEFE